MLDFDYRMAELLVSGELDNLAPSYPKGYTVTEFLDRPSPPWLIPCGV